MDTLPPSLAEPPLSEDLQPSSAVPSPTQPGPVLYMPSAAGDSVPVSPSSPHAPDLSAVRAHPGAHLGAGTCFSCPHPHAPVLGVLPRVLFSVKWGRGWLVPPERTSAWVEWGEGTKPSAATPRHTHTPFPHEVLGLLVAAVPIGRGNGRHFLGCWRGAPRGGAGGRAASQPACHPPAHSLPSPQLLCRNSSLGSPSNLCGSPPGSLRKPPNLEGIVFPGESGLAPGSYKKAPGFEREDQVGTEFLKNFKCQVSDEQSSLVGPAFPTEAVGSPCPWPLRGGAQ